MVMVCGRGLGPPSTIVKLSGLTCWNVPVLLTVMDTGMVVMLEELCSAIWPTKVPATAAAPGRLRGFTATEMSVVAAPDGAEMLSQFPPSAVVTVEDQSSVPVPALRIWISCAGTVPPVVVVAMEKLRAPATASNHGPVASLMVRVTGMLRICELVFPTTITCAIYVPAGRVTAGLTLT